MSCFGLGACAHIPGNRQEASAGLDTGLLQAEPDTGSIRILPLPDKALKTWSADGG